LTAVSFLFSFAAAFLAAIFPGGSDSYTLAK